MLEEDQKGNSQMVLIDFGFADKYIDDFGCHINDEDLKKNF